MQKVNQTRGMIAEGLGLSPEATWKQIYAAEGRQQYAHINPQDPVMQVKLHYDKVRAFRAPLWQRIKQWFGIK